MLFETLSQPKLLVILFLIGFLSGFVFDIINFIKFACNNNKITNIIFDFIGTLIDFAILFLTNLEINYGELRFFAISIFFIGFSLQRFTLGKILAKFFLWCYNVFIKFIRMLKGKFGKQSEKSKKG